MMLGAPTAIAEQVASLQALWVVVAVLAAAAVWSLAREAATRWW